MLKKGLFLDGGGMDAGIWMEKKIVKRKKNFGGKIGIVKCEDIIVKIIN